MNSIERMREEEKNIQGTERAKTGQRRRSQRNMSRDGRGGAAIVQSPWQPTSLDCTIRGFPSSLPRSPSFPLPSRVGENVDSPSLSFATSLPLSSLGPGCAEEHEKFRRGSVHCSERVRLTCSSAHNWCRRLCSSPTLSFSPHPDYPNQLAQWHRSSGKKRDQALAVR